MGLDFDPETLPWVDRDSFRERLEARLAAGEITDKDTGALKAWRRDGYLRRENLIEDELIDRLLADYENAWAQRPPVNILVEGLGVQRLSDVSPRDELGRRRFRIMDLHDVSMAGREIMLHREIVRTVRLIFDDTPVAMQSLFFEYGSEQEGHQDFPYVQSGVLSHLIGCWVACEELSADNGPLFYYRGSHRLEKYDWGGGSLVFDGKNETENLRFQTWLGRRCEEAACEKLTLEAQKGDVLFWHAGLVHGGAPAFDTDASRKSFVVHYSTATSYSRDRRAPDRVPNVFSKNGGLLYEPPKIRLRSRIKALRQRALWGARAPTPTEPSL